MYDCPACRRAQALALIVITCALRPRTQTARIKAASYSQLTTTCPQNDLIDALECLASLAIMSGMSMEQKIRCGVRAYRYVWRWYFPKLKVKTLTTNTHNSIHYHVPHISTKTSSARPHRAAGVQARVENTIRHFFETRACGCRQIAAMMSPSYCLLKWITQSAAELVV